MSCRIVINKQVSSPYPERLAPEAKIKDLMRVETATKKNLKNRLLADNQKVQMTLKEFIDHFQQDLNDPASKLIEIEETILIIREEHKTTETDISTGII